MDADPLARLLVPALLHRVNNATQVITSVNSLLRMTQDPLLLTAHAGDLEQSGLALERLGWILGAIARSTDARRLPPRRQPEGLAWLLELLREALRREGRDLAHDGGAPPRPDPRAGTGFEPGWIVASWLQACANAQPERATLGWGTRRERTGPRLWSTQAPAEPELLFARFERLLPGAGALRCASDPTTLRLPPEWFEDPGR